MMNVLRMELTFGLLALVISTLFSIDGRGRLEPHQERSRKGFDLIDSRDDTTSIRAMLDKQVEAWNRGDLEGFMDGYWKSPELTFFSGGQKLQGWEATLKRYRTRYQGKGREMGQLQFIDVESRRFNATYGFARGSWNLHSSGGERGGLFTLILHRTDRGWKITHDHTSAR